MVKKDMRLKENRRAKSCQKAIPEQLIPKLIKKKCKTKVKQNTQSLSVEIEMLKKGID